MPVLNPYKDNSSGGTAGLAIALTCYCRFFVIRVICVKCLCLSPLNDEPLYKKTNKSDPAQQAEVNFRLLVEAMDQPT